MASQTVPILPCADIDEVAAFYGHLGFATTYRQLRPYACLGLRRDDIDLQFAAIDGFVAANSYGSCIVAVDDADALYRSFADGMRDAYGREPGAGIPRFTRPRKRDGIVAGFSVVDPGGNWIRVVHRKAASDDTRQAPLVRALEAALRLADGKGDPAQAAEVLDRALVKQAGATASERAPALVYRAELAMLLGDTGRAREMVALVRSMTLSTVERIALADELERIEEIAADVATA